MAAATRKMLRKYGTRKALRGGAKGDYIGRGIQGAVEEGEKKGMIVKVLNDSAAFKKEKRVASILKELDPEQNYTLYGTHFEGNERLRVYKIHMPYGGISIESIYEQLEQAKGKSSNNAKTKALIEESFAGNEIRKMKSALKRLNAFIPRLHAAGIIHDDIHMGNLLWDGHNLRLIDWGKSVFLDSDAWFLDTSMEELFEVAEDVGKKFNVPLNKPNTPKSRNSNLINLLHGVY